MVTVVINVNVLGFIYTIDSRLGEETVTTEQF